MSAPAGESVDLTPKKGKAVNITAGLYNVVGKDGQARGTEDGKELLAEIRKGNVRSYAICVDCHRDEKKTVDMSLEKL